MFWLVRKYLQLYAQKWCLSKPVTSLPDLIQIDSSDISDDVFILEKIGKRQNACKINQHGNSERTLKSLI